MNLRTLLSLFAIVMGIGGAAALLLPAPMMNLYGVAVPDGVAVVLLRAIGATGIGLALIAWSARDMQSSVSRDAMVLGFAVLNGLSAVVLVFGALSGEFNAAAWIPVAAYAAFALLFGAAASKRAVSADEPAPAA